ncbi:MAG TPA: hypothetical protein VJS68_02140, partial [Thermoplasmata archaeon]|nr:hypothetical protein [Thermoplasmata archaeon]
MREHLVAFFESHQKLVESDALALLLTTPEPLALSRRLVEVSGADSAVVTREMVELVLTEVAPPSPRGNPVPAAPPSDAAEHVEPTPARFELVREGFVPLPEGREPLAAYSAMFNSRFRSLSRMMRGRPDLPDLRPIGEALTSHGTVSLLGMIRSVRRSPEKHHLILQLEDESGVIDLLIPRDQPLSRETLVPDEVVGLTVQLPKERGRLAIVRHLVRPEVAGARAAHRSDRPRRVMFLSDLHIGSRSFLSEPWERLAAFLHGKEGDAALARSITEIVIAGDLVDGIGIYPNQERDLAIQDIV